MAKIKELLEKLTIEEKIHLCAGNTYWSFGGIKSLHLPPIKVADATNGVRCQKKDEGYELGGKSRPSICYPTVSTFACSFDKDLIYEMGKALGQECRKNDVQLLLGPGINIKRSLLCGRNFEYFSEDPILTGKLASSWVKGIQSVGVGACLKHFAGNSQEKNRMISNSIIDEKTLWDIYLKAFEIIIKEAKPYSIMAAYNKLNGEHCCENKWLLSDVLRKEWGFDGVVISDWGAINHACSSFLAGLDVEMPGGITKDESYLLSQAKSGRFDKKRLDQIAFNILLLYKRIVKGRKKESYFNLDKNLKLAEKIAKESMVLLKNEDALPLESGIKLGIIGPFAKRPRYQGAGSSKINSIIKDNAFYELNKSNKFDIVYSKGFEVWEEKINASEIEMNTRRNVEKIANTGLLTTAVEKMKDRDAIVIFAGIPEEQESEGFDREQLSLPYIQNEIIAKFCEINKKSEKKKKIIVVLQGGGPMEMPWIDDVDGVLMTYLSGCQGGKATADILMGNANPCGKLAETFPIHISDMPVYENYPSLDLDIHYKEKDQIGYRYYESNKIDILFPFGHGLSYTKFEYSDLHTEFIQEKQNDFSFKIAFKLKNIGKLKGKEVAQVYINNELADFGKVSLMPGEEKSLEFVLTKKNFEKYSLQDRCMKVEKGLYSINIGSSIRDIRLEKNLEIEKEIKRELKIEPVHYYKSDIDQNKYNRDTPLWKLKDIAIMRPIIAIIRAVARNSSDEFIRGDRMEDVVLEQPLRSISYGTSGKISASKVKKIIRFLNKISRK